MAKLRKKSSFNKCKRLLMTIVRLDLENEIVVSNFGNGDQIGVRGNADRARNVYRGITRWYNHMFEWNKKRYKRATKQKRSSR